MYKIIYDSHTKIMYKIIYDSRTKSHMIHNTYLQLKLRKIRPCPVFSISGESYMILYIENAHRILVKS